MRDPIVPTAGTTRLTRHWDHDLADSRTTEQAVLKALSGNPAVAAIDDLSSTMGPIDFQIEARGLSFGVEVKSKRQPYRAASRVAPSIPEQYQMILDERHLREAFYRGGIFVTVVHDLPKRTWHVFTCWTLLLCPKQRWERPAARTVEFLKAKVTIDLRDADTRTTRLEATTIIDLAADAAALRGALSAWAPHVEGNAPGTT